MDRLDIETREVRDWVWRSQHTETLILVIAVIVIAMAVGFSFARCIG